MLPNHTRAVRLLGTAVVGAGLALAPLTAVPAQAAAEVEINLLNFNDFHGRIASGTKTDPVDTVQFAGTIEKERAAYPNTLLLSAGDNIGASLYNSAVAKDQPTIDVLNALDVKASAVGNHEFDKGFEDLTQRVIGSGTRNAKWDYLGANVYKVGTKTPALPEYSIQTVGGITVGVIGAVTQETPTLVSSIGIKDITFGDPVEAVNRVAAQLSDGDAANGEAQVLVAEYHEGAARSLPVPLADQVAAGGAFAEIVNKTAASVDAIFTAHTHQAYSYSAAKPGGGDRPVMQAASYSDKIAQAVLKVDASGNVTSYTAKLIDRTVDKPADLIAAYPVVKAVDAITKAALDHAALIGAQETGKIAADVTTAFSGGDWVNGVYTGGKRDDRAKESTLSNLIADSLLKTLSDPERGGAQIGMANSGGIRAELFYKAGSAVGDADGRIVRSEANSVLPFVNNLWTTTLTGAQLRSVLEEQWQPADASRPYLQLGLSSNVTYTFNPNASKGNRIGRITVNGKQVDPTDTFRVGSFSFLLAGGDNFSTFKAGTNTRDSGLVDYEAWIEYLKANSPVKPVFTKHAVVVTSAPTVKVGENYTLSVSNLDLTSLGSPANTTLKVTVDGEVVADNVPVTKGAAETTFLAKHNGPVVVTVNPTGTVVHGSVVIHKVDAKDAVPTASAKVKKGKSYTFKTNLAEIGNGVWPTGKLYTYVNGKRVDTQSLRTVEKGVQKITLTKKDLKRFGKKTVTVTTKIVRSRTVNTAVVKTIKLKIK